MLIIHVETLNPDVIQRMEHVVIGTINQGVLTDRLHARKIIEVIEGIHCCRNGEPSNSLMKSSCSNQDTSVDEYSSSSSSFSTSLWSWLGMNNKKNDNKNTSSIGNTTDEFKSDSLYSHNNNNDNIQGTIVSSEIIGDGSQQILRYQLNKPNRNRHIRKQDIDEFVHALLHPEAYGEIIAVSNVQTDIMNSSLNERKKIEKYLGRGIGIMKLIDSYSKFHEI